MTCVHLQDLEIGESFRLNIGGPLWRRAPDEGGSIMVYLIAEPDVFASRHLPTQFVYPVITDRPARRPEP